MGCGIGRAFPQYFFNNQYYMFGISTTQQCIRTDPSSMPSPLFLASQLPPSYRASLGTTIPASILSHSQTYISLGFTLIEIMVAVSIVAVLSAVAIPGLIEFILNSRLRTQSSELVANLTYARTEAIRSGQRVVVALCQANIISFVLVSAPASSPVRCQENASSGVAATGFFIFQDRDRNTSLTLPSPDPYSCPSPEHGTTPTTDCILKDLTTNTLTGKNILSISAPPNVIVFLPSGTALSLSTLTICDQRGALYARQITIDTVGQIQSWVDPNSAVAGHPKSATALVCPAS